MSCNCCICASIIEAKGDLIVGEIAGVPQRLAATSDTFILTLDSAQTLGMKWAASSSAVIPTGTGFTHITAGVQDVAAKLVDTADINASQVTNAKLANVADATLKSNISGGSAAPADNGYSAFLDYCIGNTTGTMIYRGASGWRNLAPGTVGFFLQQQSTAPVWVSSAVRGYIDGNVLSWASTTTFTAAAGNCTDSTNATNLILSAAMTKSTSAWVAGTGNGGIDTGTIANTTWYHVYIISTAGGNTVDVIFSTSASAPTLPSTYTLYRRIGSVKTDGSAHFVKFFQNNDVFLWDVPVEDVNATNPGTSAILRTLSVPTGIKVKPITNWANQAVVSNPYVLITSPDQTDTAPSSTIYTYYDLSTATITLSNHINYLWTNTSGQLRYRGSTSGAGDITRANTSGWIDPRGKDN